MSFFSRFFKDDEPEQTKYFAPGLNETSKNALRSFGEGAVDLANQLGCDVSDIGVTFSYDADGNPVAKCFYDP